jgi:hypothetical protein
MNEHIEELIVAYLHRGLTQEQESELFRACSNDPDVANQLRNHVVLSLKLRQLRDEVQVPREVRNSLLERINTIAIEHEPEKEEHRVRFGFSTGVFRWRHMLGTALSGAALAILGFAVFSGGEQTLQGSGQVTAANTAPTAVTRIDTVYRDVPHNVYITRSVTRQAQPGMEPGIAINTPSPRSDAPSPLTPAIAENVPAIPPEINLSTEKPGQQEQFVVQYNAMLASLEKVKLSSNDRVRD